MRQLVPEYTGNFNFSVYALAFGVHLSLQFVALAAEIAVVQREDIDKQSHILFRAPILADIGSLVYHL